LPWIVVAVSTEEASGALYFVLRRCHRSQDRNQFLHRVSETVYGRPQRIDRRRKCLDDLDVPLD
jgi:hypothetical protein